MFNKILKALLIQTNTTQAVLVKEIGVKPNTVSDWINKGNNPKIESIYRISDFFNASFDYLFTGKNAEPIINARDFIQDKLGADERSLINTYRELDDTGKTKMLDISKEVWADHRQPKAKLSNSQNNKSVG